MTIPNFTPGTPLSSTALRAVAKNAMTDTNTNGYGLNVPGVGRAVAETPTDTLMMVDIGEDIDRWGRDKTAKELFRDDTASGKEDHWEQGTGREWEEIADPLGAVWLAGERAVVLWDKVGRALVPLPSVRWQIAKISVELDENGCGQAEVWRVVDGTCGEYEGTGIYVPVYDWTKALTLAVGDEVKIVQHQGSKRWMIMLVENSSGGASGSGTGTTSSTTTTAEPSCDGRCKWTWSAANQVWTLVTNGCSTATTTTSSTTTSSTTTTTTTTTTTLSPTTTTTTTSSSTTTTTANPCCTTSTTTTGSPTTTTTTATPCGCIYPSHCGAVDGDCTYTYCAVGSVATSVSCTSTTTSSSTTASPCNCNTTTTIAACAGSCKFAWLPTNAGSTWVKVADPCAASCPCAFPTANGTENCEVDTRPCVSYPSTTTPQPSCTGYCRYWWLPELGVWQLLLNNCADAWNCNCSPPTVDGDNCSSIDVPCHVYGTTTTTTTDPCAFCYTTTTTSSSTTSTTIGVCDGTCLWRWDATYGYWYVMSATCASSCPCVAPPYDGLSGCEIYQGKCAATTTTTTSSTTTSSTTTAGPCVGNCEWECSDLGGGSYAWTLIDDTCSGGVSGNCVCESVPSSPPCNSGSIGVTTFNYCSTSTTGAPTTTTTTTTTTCAPCTEDTEKGTLCSGGSSNVCFWSAYNHPINGWSWIKFQEDCDAGCECLSPCKEDGISPCGVSSSTFFTPCRNTTTTASPTTTTSSTTTTTTTTSSTTTTSAPWYCMSYNGQTCSDGSGARCIQSQAGTLTIGNGYWFCNCVACNGPYATELDCSNALCASTYTSTTEEP